MTFLARASALLLSLSCLHAEDALMADPDLPQPLDFSFAENLVMNSPFTRTVNLAETFQLTGVAYVDGHPIATVLNTQTKQRIVVSEETNALGLRLVAADAGSDLHETQVELQIGDEIIAMHYQGQQLSPTGGVNGTKSRLAGSSQKDSGKLRTSSLLGDQGRELYASLSHEGRDKFKELMKSRAEKHPELTPEQKMDYAQKIIAKLKAADQPDTKNAKPQKKKQGA
jgi:hypothetical protein